MRWLGVTRYVDQFTWAVLPHDFNLLTSGRQRLPWFGIGHDLNDDVTLEIHGRDPEDARGNNWHADQPDEVAYVRYWVVEDGNADPVGCPTLAAAVAYCCEFFDPTCDKEVVDDVVAALAAKGMRQ